MVVSKGFFVAEMLVEKSVGKRVVTMVLCLVGSTDPVVVETSEKITAENLVASSADSWAYMTVAELVEKCFDAMVSQ